MSEQQAEYKIEGRPATIFRTVHDKDNPYVTINKTAIDNPNLSFKAKGILTYLMSRPDGWEVSVSDLMKRSIDKEWSVRSGLKELRDVGHMRYTVSREQGRITGWLIEVYEIPQDGLIDNQPTDEILDETASPDIGNLNVATHTGGGSPDRGFPQVENPQVGNQVQVLSTLSNKESSNKTTTRGDVFKVYTSEIGLLTPRISDAINDYLDDLKIPPEWIIDAIHIATEQNKRNWAYCAAILKRWSLEGKTALPPKQSYPAKYSTKSFAQRVMES